MTTHRDLSSYDDGNEQRARILALEQERNHMGDHIDRLYEKYYDLWEAVEKLSEGIAQTVPLPLKYK